MQIYTALRIPGAVLLTVVCLILGGCGDRSNEEVRAASAEYELALTTRDLPKIRQLIIAEHAKDLNTPRAEAVVKIMLNFRPQNTKIRFVDVAADKQSATVGIEGTREGKKIDGTQKWVRENNVWKVADENWNTGEENAGNATTKPAGP